jgi:hypothetical protein
MNILKRLSMLSIDDLHQLQKAVLVEIHRRKEIARNAADILVIGGQKRGRRGHSAPASKSVPAVAPPVPRRRAA